MSGWRAWSLWAVVVAIGVTLYHVEGDLAVPWGSAEQLRAWLDTTDPAVVAMAGLRVAALAVCAYLALVLGAVAVARATGRHRAARRALRLLPTVLRYVLVGSVGFAGLNGIATAPVGATPQPEELEEPVAIMVKLPPEADDAAGADASEEPPPERAPETWVVEPGQSFWSVARDVLAGDDAPDDAGIARYWRRLIDTNRDRLADPDNPDLLFPGQELLLPPR